MTDPLLIKNKELFEKEVHKLDILKLNGEITHPKILVVNKIDLCNNIRKLKWMISELEDLGKFDHIFYTSCETGYGIEDLKE